MFEVTLGLAKWQRVIFVGQLGVRGRHFDGFQSDLVALLEVRRCHARDVEAGGSDVRADKCQQD